MQVQQQQEGRMPKPKKRTVIIYLIGKPGAGKYTISQEIAKAGYVVCDNHLVNNPILALLNYDGVMPVSDFAWSSIAKIRNVVFNFIAHDSHNNYVLTNVLYEDAGDRSLYRKVARIALRRKSIFVPVKLLLSEEENLKRIIRPNRLLRYKSVDPKDALCKRKLIQVSNPNLLELDVTKLSSAKAAKKILEHVSFLSISH